MKREELLAARAEYWRLHNQVWSRGFVTKGACRNRQDCEYYFRQIESINKELREMRESGK